MSTNIVPRRIVLWVSASSSLLYLSASGCGGGEQPGVGSGAREGTEPAPSTGDAAGTSLPSLQPEPPSERDLMEDELRRAASANVGERCQRYLRCCHADYLSIVGWHDETDCVTNLQSAQTRVLLERMPSIEAGYARLDSEAIDACSELAQQTSDVCVPPESCHIDDMIVPQSARGEGCLVHLDCRGEAYCASGSTCTPQLQQAEPCDHDYECRSGRCSQTCQAEAVDGSGCDGG